VQQSCVHRTVFSIVLILLFCLPQLVARGQGEFDEDYSITANSIVYDGQYVYIAGSISNFQDQSLVNPLDLSGGMDDMFLIKLSANGAPIFSAVIGGSNDDKAFSIAVDQGVVYLFGETWSTDFPRAPGNAGESDAVLCAIAADGSGLLWSRRIAGTDQESGRSVMSYNNKLYLTGITWSDNLGADAALGSSDGFLARVSFSGEVDWLRRFGGFGLDAPFDLTVAADSLWVGGQTFSRDFGGTLHGEGDAFAAQFSLAGEQIIARVYGGSEDDLVFALSHDGEGGILMAGGTNSDDIKNAEGEFRGNFDAITFHLNSDGELENAAYLGGDQPEYGQDIIALPGGDYFVIGWTESAVFSSSSGDQTSSHGLVDTFIVRVGRDGTQVVEKLIGGPNDDFAKAGVFVPEGLWLVGDFPNQGLGYALLISSDIVGDIIGPTATAIAPTATNAMTATLAPTETPAPMSEYTPTSYAIQAMTGSSEPQVTVDDNKTDGESPTNEESANALMASPTNGSNEVDASVIDIPSANNETTSSDENHDKRQSGIVAGGIIILIIALTSGSYYWLRRKKQQIE